MVVRITKVARMHAIRVPGMVSLCGAAGAWFTAVRDGPFALFS